MKFNIGYDRSQPYQHLYRSVLSFSTLAAILGPILYGFIIKFSDGTYNLLMLVSPIFLASALINLSGARSGEAQPE